MIRAGATQFDASANTLIKNNSIVALSAEWPTKPLCESSKTSFQRAWIEISIQ
jgi:hypothetical protein